MSTQPRQHHYIFGHVAMRSLTQSDPAQMLAVLASPRAQEFLESLWGRVGEDLPEGDRVDAAGLGVVMEALDDGGPVAIVTLPEPAGMTEAHMIAVAGTSSGCRFITLEYTLSALDESATPQTVLCEWSDQAHLNFGEGPEPTRAAFLAAVKKLVAGKDDAG